MALLLSCLLNPGTVILSQGCEQRVNQPVWLRPDRERTLLAALLVFVFLNGLVWSLTIPFDGAPDEIHKYEIVYFIWRNHRLPVLGPSEDVYIRPAPGTRDGYVYGAAATYPSGAYLLAALFLSLTPSDAPMVLLQAARLSSVLCTVATIYLAYRIIRTLFASAGYALGAATLIALIPQFTYTGAYVGDDAYTIMAVTWSIWSAARGLRQGWTLRTTSSMGLALILVSLGKQNGWVAVFPFVLLVLASAWRGDWRTRLRVFAGALLPPCLTLGAWLARNWLLYRDPMALRVAQIAWQDYITRLGFEWVPLVERGYGFLDLLTKTRWLRTLFESFWGRFFYMNVAMDPPIYQALLAGCICGVAATVWALFRNREDVLPTGLVVKILSCAGLALVLLLATAATTSIYRDYQAQARYLFPLIVPIAISLTVGGHVLVRSHSRRLLAGLWIVVLILLFALNAFSLIRYVHGHPYPEIPLPVF
jgi:4-amino-4-deoxy-L-arabinose transferase-like glycosyltransferase